MSKFLFLLVSVIVISLIFIVAEFKEANAFASFNDAATEDDCRVCHCNEVPSKHHVNKNISVYGCTHCHPVVYDDVSRSNTIRLTRDCTTSECHGSVVGPVHHTGSILVSNSCFTCHQAITESGAGIYTISLGSTCKAVAPEPTNNPPVAVAAADSQIALGQTAYFDAGASSDPDGKIVSYHWDLGDGSYAGVVRTGHLYAKPGVYNVTLSVTDDKGAKTSKSTTITVKKERKKGYVKKISRFE